MKQSAEVENIFIFIFIFNVVKAREISSFACVDYENPHGVFLHNRHLRHA